VCDAGFAEAIEQYLHAERQAVDQEIEVLTSWGPFRKAQVEEQE
jgi:predicted N-acyltransferase